MTIVVSLILLVIQFSILFYQWKLEQDFKEWMIDIDMEFFKNYAKFKEE